MALWFLVSGYVLVLSPWTPLVWSDAFFARWPDVRFVLWLAPVRLAISAVGGWLLVVGSWDVIGLLPGRRA